MNVEFITSKNKSLDLDAYKQLRIDCLTNNFANVELQTFKSTALSATPLTYMSRLEDMLLLSGEYAFVKSNDYAGENIMWYTVESGNLVHTGEQFVSVYLAARLNVQTIKYKMANLTAQIMACTDQSQVDAISWSG